MPSIAPDGGMAIFFFYNNGNKKNESTDTEKQRKRKGVYYEALNKKAVKGKYNPLASYGYSSLYYNGKVYTSNSINRISCSSAEYRSLQRKELSAVYGNRYIYWSADSADLFEVTGEGTLYQLKEFNIDKRVCLQPKDSDYMNIYDCLNGIWLLQGKDLYKDIFHLDNAKEVYAKTSDNTAVLVESNDDVFSAFFSSLCEAKFIPEENVPEFEDDEGNYFLFKDAFGIQTEIQIFAEGYVIFFSPEKTRYVIKLDKQICNKIYTKYF